tara:strand:+ start:3212 stop:4672 length:1461 start_codon:yes stop_codon:yes gene_type:complete
MSNRKLDRLSHLKSDRGTIKTGFPSREEGVEGGSQIRYIPGYGLSLFAFYSGNWYTSKMELQKVGKTKKKLSVDELEIKSKLDLNKIPVKNLDPDKIDGAKKWNDTHKNLISGEFTPKFKETITDKIKFPGNNKVELSVESGSLVTTMDGVSGGNLKIVRDVNNGNPTIQMGSADTESFYITAGYAGGGKGLDYVTFESKTAQDSGNEGQMSFNVDEVSIMKLNDTGTTLYTPGSVTNDTAVLTLENNASASSMTGTGTAILFNQMAHHAETPTMVDAAKINVATEGNWSSETGDTQDAEMTFDVVENGNMTERLKISSNGAHTITSQANPQLKINYTADDYFSIGVAANGATTMTTVDDGLGTSGNLNLVADGYISMVATSNSYKFNGVQLGSEVMLYNIDATTPVMYHKFPHAANQNDYFRIGVALNGNTILETVDADTVVAHLTLQPYGDTYINPKSGKIQFQINSTPIGNYMNPVVASMIFK